MSSYSRHVRIAVFLLIVIQTSSVFAHARMMLGIDNLLMHHREIVTGKRIGIVTNQTGVTGDGHRTIDALCAVPGVSLAAVFTPEHGLNGTIAAGNTVRSDVDSATNAPVISLYGALRKPKKEMLNGIDVLIYDIQDIGIRSYTFISTLGLVMKAAAEANVKMVVLDRPSVLATRVDGNVLDTAFRSFVGMYPIPYVYGMTVGELATMINNEAMIPNRCLLTVVPMIGWRRSMPWDSTGLQWRPTSPNIPVPSTAIYCAAFGALGELGVGYQGIGSRDAFRVFGGAKLPMRCIDSAFVALHLGGVHTTVSDTVVITKAGVTMPITIMRFAFDCDSVADLFAVGLHLLAILQRMHCLKQPDSAHIAMFNKVCGGAMFAKIVAGTSVDALELEWRAAREQYRLRRAKYLLYP